MFRVCAWAGLFCLAGAVQAQSVVSTVAGGSPPVTPAAALQVSIGDPPRVAVDAAGNLYFGSLHTLFKTDGTGTLWRVAGNGRSGYSGDSGPALSAQLEYPSGIAFDSNGNIFVADRDACVVRRIDSSGVISTVAGTGTPGYSGDGGPAIAAQLSGPMGIALDPHGVLYIADADNQAIRRVTLDGVISTVAGIGLGGYSGDGGPAIAAALWEPEGIAADTAGNIYIADTANDRVRSVTSEGIISTIAGNGLSAVYGNIYEGTGISSTTGDGGPATAASVVLPTDVTLDTAGNIYIADYGNGRLREIANGTINTIAGTVDGVPLETGQTALSEALNGPTSLALGAGSVLYFAEGSIGTGSGLGPGDFRVWQINSAGLMEVAAGNGIESYSGDGGDAALAQLNMPANMAIDRAGNLYVADTRNHRIRKITPAGVISTVAGTGVPGYSGDGTPATGAQLNSPRGVAVDHEGTLYIADTGNNRIRLLAVDGTMFTLAGNGNAAYYGDNGPAGTASVHAPEAVVVDASGNIFVADTGNQRVRMITPQFVIHTIAGNGNRGFSGDGPVATQVALNEPAGIAVDGAGNVYVADTGNGRVRVISAAGGISTLVGDGSLASPLSIPRGLALDNAGNLYIADTGHNLIREMAPGAALTTIAGSGAVGYAGDGGPALSASFNTPWGVAADTSGNVYFSDSANNAIRAVTPLRNEPTVAAVTNGASNQVSAIAPGEVVVVYGSGLGPGLLAQVAGVSPATEAGNASLLFNGTPGQILYASATQISAVVPPSLTASTVVITAQYGNLTSASVTVPVAPAAPALFTQNDAGSGQALAFNQDGTRNGPNSPARAGSTVTLFATGLAVGPLPTVLMRNILAPVQSVTPAGPGVSQIAVQVPNILTSGSVSVVLESVSVASPSGVTIAVAGN